MIELALAGFLFVQAQPQITEVPAVTRWVQIGPDTYLVEVTPCGPLPNCTFRISPDARPPTNEARK